jgi:hypothetical protein
MRAAGLERVREVLGDQAERAEAILAAVGSWLVARAAAEAEEAAAAEASAAESRASEASAADAASAEPAASAEGDAR